MYKPIAERRKDQEKRDRIIKHKQDTYTLYRRVLNALAGEKPSVYTLDSAGSLDTEYGYAYDSGYKITVKIMQNHSDTAFVQVSVTPEQAVKLAEFLKTL